jgi:hypothetical protein
VNTWYHIAFVRTGTTFRTFLDGSQLGADYTDADAVPDLVSVAQIGGYGLAGANYLNGWLDEFRISKGIARWTSNFTPSTSAPTGDSNTVLLLHMDGADGSNTFIDG